MRINFIKNYMAQVVKVVFDAHLKIQYKIQSDNLMHLYYMNEFRMKILSNTSAESRIPSEEKVNGARSTLE